jgi:hypothetical protein
MNAESVHKKVNTTTVDYIITDRIATTDNSPEPEISI